MKTKVDISPAILKWVMAHGQIDDLPSRTRGLLESWVSGEKEPTFNQIELVSRATGIPLGYFFLQTPPQEDLSIVEYRTIDSVELNNPSRNLIDTLHDMDRIQEWMRNALISDGSAPLAFIGSLNGETSVERFAQSVRTLLGIEKTWYKKTHSAEESFSLIRNAISSTGTIVMMSGIVGNNTHRPLNIDEFRAFSIIDEYAPLIFINSNDSINGKLFSLLHEFAHICVGENNLFNDRYSSGAKVKKIETICNAVAAEILVPQSFFVSNWNSEANSGTVEIEAVINSLARSFKCGITVIARRAYDNGFINFQQYQTTAKCAVKLYNDSRRRKKENGESGGDYYKTAASRIDKRFFAKLVSSVFDGKTLYSDAFRLTNTNRSSFANLVESIGGGVK